MWINRLTIKDFRNFTDLQVSLKNGINIIHGDNANGKTNFIEAIYFCATGKSQRAGHDRELIRFGEAEAHLQTEIQSDSDGQRQLIDVHLFRDGRKKGIAIDRISIKKLDNLLGLLLVVIFTPEDLRMIKAGPAERRAFMDLELCQLTGIYYYALKRYYQTLKQRNNLLKSIPKNPVLQDTISVWNEPLYKYGTQIIKYRTAFAEEIGELAAEILQNITGGKEVLAVNYKPQVRIEEYAERLIKSQQRDIVLGSTSVGVHKDDLIFTIDGNDARIYGSQGQQRTVALSVKLAEIKLIKQRTRHTPVLLLDDVLSELDENRQAALLRHIRDLQTVITCTGTENILGKNATNTMKMVAGKISKV
ncbi:MAG: DNA replication/repair protein RecF [Turicibacter sp.]|nr:DNA replication/repair protein RecF [Turicibacter sp.]